MEEKRKWYSMFEYVRREKGYQQGWVAHKYREKFDCWPKNMKDIGPQLPDLEFNNYMKYLRIKFIKSKQKQERQARG